MKKYLKKRYFTKDEENKNASKCILKILDVNSIIPLVDGFFGKFLFKKDFSPLTLGKRRQEILSEMIKGGNVATIHTVITKEKTKKTGKKKVLPQRWFDIAVNKDIVYQWYALEENSIKERLLTSVIKRKVGKALYEKANQEISFEIIAKMFRNKFFIFYDSGKSWDSTSEKIFMRKCKEKIVQAMSCINKLKKDDQDNNNGKLQELEDIESTIKSEEYTSKIRDNKDFQEFVSEKYDEINKNFESQSYPQATPVYPSYDSLREAFEKEKSNIVYTKEDISLKKIQQAVLNKQKEILKSVHHMKIRWYRFKSTPIKDFFRCRVEKSTQNLKFELVKHKNNVRALSVLNKELSKAGLKRKEKHIAFSVSEDGVSRDVWVTRDYTGNNLTCSFNVYKEIWRGLAFLFRKDCSKFLEFAMQIGANIKKQAKFINEFGRLQKEHWVTIIKKTLSKLIYT